ncbi:ATP-binding protein [Candidatus Nitrotoga sp. M5]|uniref:ATP-binding protein n=1 Tax=Candidatus Nitrotoga sp. M5 TaxID=2890409 RepID=UPI001EF3B816|nr:ATP-binding protein [Candidatus Nitrotoga sp. M5]CAH1385162.1 putative ATP-binding protein involved in virulence [Candidatus Nitrotoga sp. M5]
MKIDYLSIRSRFKNLENVCINFDEEHLMTVIVGCNGSGKSNVLEALVAIFRNLDLGEPPPFSYELRYLLGEDSDAMWILVDADPKRGSLGAQYQIKVTQQSSGKWAENVIPVSRVQRDKSGHAPYLPRYLFAYYSGPSDRLEQYFRKHRTDFYRKLLKNEVDLTGDIRPLFYAKPVHSQFVLLAFFLGMENDNERKFLLDEFGIEALDSVHFVMRKPDWAKKKGELFWGASGVVREFLDELYPHTLAPLKITRNEEMSLTGKNIKNEFFHLFLQNADVLRKFANKMTPDVFFKMLESTLLSEIISEVSIRVRVKSSGDALSFRELSEGEQQLLTVLGLLKFTGGKDSLFLLDEPDTHINPLWAIKYLKMLKTFVQNGNTSHLLMVTHHPLAIAELERGQVQVMSQDAVSHQVHAEPPAESPRGMGYAGILTSDMFGLQSTLDQPTEDLIRARRSFLEKDALTEDEKKRLAEIDKQIEVLGFTTAHWDSDYQEYLRARKKLDAKLFELSPVTPEIRRKRSARALEILAKIKNKEVKGSLT